MELLNKIFNRRYKYIWISIIALAVIYLVLKLFFFSSDPLILFLSWINNGYLLLAENLSDRLLHFFGSDIIIKNHQVLLNSVVAEGFKIEIRLKKWMLLFLFLIIVTRTSSKKRILYSLVLIAAHFLIIVGYTAFGAIISCGTDPDFSYLSIPVTIGLLILVSILFLFFRDQKEAVFKTLERFKINTDLFKNGFIVYLVVCFLIILTNFLFIFFDYLPWINFLFSSAQKILALLGYEAVVKPFELVGPKCSIAMLKACLGFQTMLLFAVLVLLTGHESRYRWIYVIAGIIFLNIVNILRFVFLFIHLYKHGDYMLTMELHDMFNLVTYTIVFILWIIWFEKFADATKKSKDKDIAT
jgi:exosortase/archaeosortase family protein